MAYPYPIQYPYQQPLSPYPSPTPNLMANNSDNPIVWVQGEAGAKSFLVAPNKTIPLWDSENQTIYLKSADASGMPSIKILDYTIRERETPQKPLGGTESRIGDYATKDDLEALKKEIKGEISEIVKKEIGA